MATTTTDSICTTLGKIRKGLVEQGFKEEEAFQMTLDLVRRADSLPAVVQLES